MKRLMLTIVMACYFAFPMAAIADNHTGTGWFTLPAPHSHIDIYSEPGYRKGKLKCRPARGSVFSVTNQAGTGKNHAFVNNVDYAHVHWRKRLGTMEWHYKDRFGKWCPIWERYGWVELRLLRSMPSQNSWRWIW